MPAEFPYMTTARNLKPILERLKGAGTPPKFTLDFLRSLGFTSSSDRPIIGVLKALGFLSADGMPTERYNSFRDTGRSGLAMADGLRDGWAPVFLADQSANMKSSSQLTELFKSVSGKGEAVSAKMATTFKGLCEMADWDAASAPSVPLSDLGPSDVDLGQEREPPRHRSGVLTLHHDVHLHLPPTSDVSVYTAIFRALKAELLD